MSRINTNIASLRAITTLAQNQSDLQTHLERLSTGLQINSGADNPSGLIASENMRSEIAGINQAVSNSQRATNVISTAEGSLSEVSSLLTQLQSLVNESANTGALSSDEISANQLQADSILTSINRISNTTQFNGVSLLDGSLDYTTSGVLSGKVADLQINAATLPESGARTVTVGVTASAKLGTLKTTTAGIGSSAATVEIRGTDGSQQLSFAASTHNSAIIVAINQVKDSTGVSASLGTSGITLNSTDYGSAEFVSVKTISGHFVNGENSGADAKVSVNGTSADVKGTIASVRTADLDLTINLKAAFAQQTTAGTSFDITGGGAKFQLGSIVDSNGQINVGISSVSTTKLGNAVDGYLSSVGSGGANSLVSGNTIEAQNILSDSISQVATLRGRLGALQTNVLETNINSLNVALENVTSSESDIRDADFATETAALTRAQVLVSANTSVLAQANSTPQQVLTLLQNL